VLHTPPGSSVELSLRRQGPRAVLEVRDHGAGVPDDAAASGQLFERFWRSDGGRRRGRGGAGLGLAIVRAIAHAHGGDVSAANAPGGGARFTVELPLNEPGDPSQENLSLLTSDS
jgi:two-component system, OmpR family, sensor kinase